MSIDWRNCVCLKRLPRSSTRMCRGSTPAARYSSDSRWAEIEPPKPEPTVQTSTRSAIGLGQASVAGAPVRELAPVAEAAVAVRRGARVAHDAVARGAAARGVRYQRRRAERGERHGGGRLPEHAVAVAEVEPLEHDGLALRARQRDDRPAVAQRARVEVGDEGGRERVEAHARVVVELDRAGLDG